MKKIFVCILVFVLFCLSACSMPQFEKVQIVNCIIQDDVIIHDEFYSSKAKGYIEYKEIKTVYLYTVETEDGNLWDFSATEDLREKNITVIFDTMNTEDIYDDEIIDYIIF